MSIALAMRAIKKRFGAVEALAGVDFEVREGEAHALIGENGAGKSTLMKVLSGAHTPDSGEMELFGKPYAPRGPLDALRQGVAMIYQELQLAPDLTIAQNLVLGAERHSWGWIQRAANHELVGPVLELFDHPELEPHRLVGALSPGAQQLVAIGRALVLDARVVILDEPTASLSARETATLDEILTRLKSRGVSIIYITHFLEDAIRVAEAYTVLRDGQSVSSGSTEAVEVVQLAEAMVGRELGQAYPRVEHTPGEPILQCKGLGGQTLPVEASFELRRGEILGVAGLVGAGRTEMLRALFGLDKLVCGEVRIAGVVLGRGIRARLKQGMGLVSEDRKSEGLALGRSIAENLTLSHMKPFAKAGFLDKSARARVTERWIDKLAIKSRDPDQSIAELSGGNQQKVAIARLLHQDADVLLLDEPTRGVDIGSKAEIYRLIGELAAQGKAVLMVSSYLPELLGICDRVAVMHRGRLRDARPSNQWTEESLLQAASLQESA